MQAATDNLEAYELYLKGRELANRVTVPALDQAIAYFDRAIEHDPGFAAAHAARANAHCWLGFAGARAPHDLYGQARRSAERALELDELLSDAHVAIAAVYFEYEWNWDAADAAFRRALELHPNSAFAHWTYGYYLGNIGRFEESTAHNDQAIDLDPLWVNPHQGKAAFAYFEHKDEEALAGHLRASRPNRNARCGRMKL